MHRIATIPHIDQIGFSEDLPAIEREREGLRLPLRCLHLVARIRHSPSLESIERLRDRRTNRCSLGGGASHHPRSPPCRSADVHPRSGQDSRSPSWRSARHR